MDVNSLDTKTRIFTTALRMFASEGVENVSIRAIANSVGIKAASIYNHYSSKEQILDACYDFFVQHRYLTRLTKEEYESILKNGTKNEVFAILSYSFPDVILENMIMSLIIIFSRIYSDNKAKEIYVDDLNNSMKYLEEFFTLGVKIGRFSEFNITSVSLVVLSVRVFLAQSVTISPLQKSDWHNAQGNMFDELMNLIPFKY